MDPRPNGTSVDIARGLGIGLLPWAGMAIGVTLQILIGFNNLYPSIAGYGLAAIGYAITVLLARVTLRPPIPSGCRIVLRAIVVLNFPVLLIFAWWWFVFAFSHGFTSMY